MNAIGISVVIPVYNEVESVTALHERLARVLRAQSEAYEILFVDDGSTDGTLDRLAEIVAGDEHVRALGFRRNFGKSAALAAGFKEARGARVITMDGDLQDDPDEIGGLLAKLEEGYDLVSGWKRQRHDPFTKTFPSRVFNQLCSWATGVKLHDVNCGFKAYRQEVVKTVRVYGELHRLIPVLAAGRGFRVTELAVKHHPRQHGKSKYGAARFINGILDLLTVLFLGSSRKSPLHVFGRIGGFCLATGLAITLYMLSIWIIEHALRVRPLLIGGVILVILGIQFISMGLLAEMIVSTHRGEEEYTIGRRLP